MKIVLASQSPRRRELISRIAEAFEVQTSEADESIPKGSAPAEAVRMLSRKKAEAVANLAENQGKCVIGADTVVALEGEILGKPHSEEEAKRMLRNLSGCRHQVYTGVTVLSPNGEESWTSQTEVQFYPLTEDEIQAYVATGEPMDKAGAYGIQGKGALLIQGIVGDFYTVMGFPVAEVYRALNRLKALK